MLNDSRGKKEKYISTSLSLSLSLFLFPSLSLSSSIKRPMVEGWDTHTHRTEKAQTNHNNRTLIDYLLCSNTLRQLVDSKRQKNNYLGTVGCPNDTRTDWRWRKCVVVALLCFSLCSVPLLTCVCFCYCLSLSRLAPCPCDQLDQSKPFISTTRRRTTRDNTLVDDRIRYTRGPMPW
jgi:hypothetical protein